jgi:hypothetical protein
LSDLDGGSPGGNGSSSPAGGGVHSWDIEPHPPGVGEPRPLGGFCESLCACAIGGERYGVGDGRQLPDAKSDRDGVVF